MFIPHRKHRLFVGAALGVGEKSGNFVVAGQFELLDMGEHRILSNYGARGAVSRFRLAFGCFWGLTKVRLTFILRGSSLLFAKVV